MSARQQEHWLKIDFAKWKDEDDSGDDEKPDDYGQGMEGMGGPPGMGGGPPGMGGMGGMGGGPPGMGGMPPGMDMEAVSFKVDASIPPDPPHSIPAYTIMAPACR